MGILSGLLEGVNAGIEKQRAEKRKQADTEAEAAKARGTEILKGIIGGDIEQTERPEEAIINEPGQVIKRGLFGKAEATPGRMYKRGKVKDGGTKPQDILALLAGIKPAEDSLSAETISRLAPSSYGEVAGGGEVLAMPGQAGEYLPGYEPKKRPDLIKDLIGSDLGISKEEATRKYFGLPQKKPPTQSIVDKTGKVIGERPTGSVFQPQEMGFQIPTAETAPKTTPQQVSRYKAGDKKVIDGITYIRNAQGQWLPQS